MLRIEAICRHPCPILRRQNSAKPNATNENGDKSRNLRFGDSPRNLRRAQKEESGAHQD
jgi:hypothetical protein